MIFIKGQPKPLKAYTFPKGHKINLGKKRTSERIEQMRKIAIKKGFGKWMKGRRNSQKTEFKKGELAKNWSGFVKGNRAWNKNLHHLAISGEKSHLWKGGITPINKAIRSSLEYEEWRRKVFERDLYTCQDCGQIGGYLQADHIKPFAYFPDLRFELSNGRTLCIDCHKKTDTYMGRAKKFEEERI